MKEAQLPKRLCPPSGWHRLFPIPSEQGGIAPGEQESISGVWSSCIIFELFLHDNAVGMKICFKSEVCVNDAEMENGKHLLKEGVIITVDQCQPLFTTTPFVFRSN